MPTLEALTEEQLGALDASYRPFPCFSAWPRHAVHVELWTRRLQRLKDLQDSVSAVESDRARLVALRAAAFDTGALEGLYSTNRGLTWSVATQAAAWESTLVEESPDARALFDAQLRTYELALDAATQRLPLSEALVRRLHEELTAPQETYLVHTPVGTQEQPLPRGQYKKHPNHVRAAGGEAHAYAPVLDTASEMHRLIEELEHPEFRQAHSIIQAAYAHYCLVAIHPFADGNGRVARAVASIFLYRAAPVPLLIFADERDRYFQSLAEADTGQPQGFINFVEHAALSAVSMIIEGLETASAPDPRAVIGDLREILLAQGDLTHSELDVVARRLAEDVRETLAELISGLDLPAGVRVYVTSGAGELHEPSRGFRHIIGGGPACVGLGLDSAPPADAALALRLEVYVSLTRDDAETFLIQTLPPPGEWEIRLGLQEVHPQLTMAAQERLRLLSERVVGVQLQQLTVRAREALDRAGYHRP